VPPPQEGSEAHARGLPLLGAIHAAFLPEQAHQRVWRQMTCRAGAHPDLMASAPGVSALVTSADTGSPESPVPMAVTREERQGEEGEEWGSRGHRQAEAEDKKVRSIITKGCDHVTASTGLSALVEMPCGADVEMHSLVRSPELNGGRGKVVEPQDPGTGRCGVKIDSDGRVLALKPANLARLCGNVACGKALVPPLLQCSKCKCEAYCCKACQVPPPPRAARARSCAH